MAVVNAPSEYHAGRRADVYGQMLGYESADPWNRVGATALHPARQTHRPAPRRGWIAEVLRSIAIRLAGH